MIVNKKEIALLKQKRVSKHNLEMEAKANCSMCKKQCHHDQEEKHTRPCECKLRNLRGPCVHFIDKRDTFKRD